MHTNCVPGLTILDRPELEQELRWLSVTGTDSAPPPASSPDPPGRCTEGHLELGKSACFQFQESRFTSLVLPSFLKGNPPTNKPWHCVGVWRGNKAAQEAALCVRAR